MPGPHSLRARIRLLRAAATRAGLTSLPPPLAAARAAAAPAAPPPPTRAPPRPSARPSRQNNINISFMSVSRAGKGTEAIMAIGVDEVPSAEVRRRRQLALALPQTVAPRHARARRRAGGAEARVAWCGPPRAPRPPPLPPRLLLPRRWSRRSRRSRACRRWPCSPTAACRRKRAPTSQRCPRVARRALARPACASARPGPQRRADRMHPPPAAPT